MLLYMPRWWYNAYGGGSRALADLILWNSQYSSNPNLSPFAGDNIEILQYSSTAPIAGLCSPGTGDQNIAINMSAQQFLGKITGTTGPPVTPPTTEEDEDMPYLVASRFTGVSLHDGAGGTWISDPATVTELVNQGIKVVRIDANESDARRFVMEHAAGTDEKILDLTNAEVMYTAAVAQIEAREEVRDLAALPAPEDNPS
jgi:hypothetical protein